MFVIDEARAQTTCPPDPPAEPGQIVENTVFEEVFREDITEVRERIVNGMAGRVFGVGKVFPNLASFERGLPPVFEVMEDSGIVDESDIPDTLSSIRDIITQELLDEFPEGETSSSSRFLDQSVEVLSSNTVRIDNGQTIDFETTLSNFHLCFGAVLIGDIEDYPNIVVTGGLLIVNLVETQFTTQFYTDIITETVNLTDNYEVEVIMILDGSPLAAPIPTMTEWGMIALAVVMLPVSVVYVRRKPAA